MLKLTALRLLVKMGQRPSLLDQVGHFDAKAQLSAFHPQTLGEPWKPSSQILNPNQQDPGLSNAKTKTAGAWP